MALEGASWEGTQKYILQKEAKHPRGVYQEFPIQNLAKKQWEDTEFISYWKLLLGHQLRDPLAGKRSENTMCFTNCSSVYTSHIGIQYVDSITHDWCSL